MRSILRIENIAFDDVILKVTMTSTRHSVFKYNYECIVLTQRGFGSMATSSIVQWKILIKIPSNLVNDKLNEMRMVQAHGVRQSNIIYRSHANNKILIQSNVSDGGQRERER